MKKGKLYPKSDQLTRKINRLFLKIPQLGSRISQIYLWRYMMFNSMFIGATGMVLNFLLYEGIFRRILVVFLGGTFLAMVITTFLVFMWNYVWARQWSLSVKSQLLSMNKDELAALREKIDALLKSKFDDEGKRIGWQ